MTVIVIRLKNILALYMQGNLSIFTVKFSKNTIGLATVLSHISHMTCFLIEVKFHIETSQVEGNVYGHMTKMAATPIKGKKPLKIFSGTKRPMALGLCMQHSGCGPYKVCTNDNSGLTLTYFTTRSNLILNAFFWRNL